VEHRFRYIVQKSKYKRWIYATMIIFMIIMGCCTFPFINVTHRWPLSISAINAVLTVVIYHELGMMEAELLPGYSWGRILLINLMLVLAGMGSRYLLEFGEVSNTYNFTWKNMLLHVMVTVGGVTTAWFYNRDKEVGG